MVMSVASKDSFAGGCAAATDIYIQISHSQQVMRVYILISSSLPLTRITKITSIGFTGQSFIINACIMHKAYSPVERDVR